MRCGRRGQGRRRPGGDRAGFRAKPYRGRWHTIVCIASGPSLTRDDCETVRAWRQEGPGRGVVVVNTSYRIAPWADVLYAMDEQWWKEYLWEARTVFAGQLVAPFSHLPGVARAASPRKMNSGAGALAFAAHVGARRIILLGYDGQRTGGAAHWHGDHPVSLPNAGCADQWPAQFRAMLPELRGIEVLNCSRATALDAFPRMDLEDVLCSTPGCRGSETTSTNARSSAKCLESIT